MFAAFAASGSTCERIVHLASYPVDCYELVVRSSDHASLRESLVEVAGTADIDLAVQRAGLHRRAKHLVVMDADSTLLQDEVIDSARRGVWLCRRSLRDHGVGDVRRDRLRRGASSSGGLVGGAPGHRCSTMFGRVFD